jgi:rhodanese-related sulfurtransferase
VVLQGVVDAPRIDGKDGVAGWSVLASIHRRTLTAAAANTWSATSSSSAIVLEWRLDPASPYRIPEVHGYDQPIVILCSEGYTSSLAAAVLQDRGLHQATDLIGGFRAWEAGGLAVTAGPGR